MKASRSSLPLLELPRKPAASHPTSKVMIAPNLGVWKFGGSPDGFSLRSTGVLRMAARSVHKDLDREYLSSADRFASRRARSPKCSIGRLRNTASRARSRSTMAPSSPAARSTDGVPPHCSARGHLPGKRVENGYIESFNGKLRDECLNANQFSSVDDARSKIRPSDCRIYRL